MYSSRFLSHVGTHAEIDSDAFNDGAFILSIGGAQQSHVDLADPCNVFYEYLRRIANVLDVFKPAGDPIRVLHLGAGALTLARYVQATRPGSAQAAVELERELLDFLLEHLPLPEGTNCTILTEDAREAAAQFPAGSFDAVVLDVFAGEDAPEHLADAGFYSELTALIGPGGVVLINVGDDPPLAFARRQARLVRQTGYDAAALADAAMFSGRHPGNIVLAAVRDQWPPAWTEALLAAGPHPAAVLTCVDLEEFAAN